MYILYIKTVAGRAFHAKAIRDVIFSPPEMNTPHNDLNMTLMFKKP